MVIRLLLGVWIEEKIDGSVTHYPVLVERFIHGDDCHKSDASGIKLVFTEFPPEEEHGVVGHGVEVGTSCFRLEDLLVAAIVHLHVDLTDGDFIGSIPYGIDVEVNSHTLLEWLIQPLLIFEWYVGVVIELNILGSILIRYKYLYITLLFSWGVVSSSWIAS